MLVQSFIERLRPLVGSKSWDYIVLWKLSDDNRCIEWLDCCCGGTQNIENGGEDVNFQDCYTSVPCRDILFPHPRITSCELLDQIPSMILDSGVHSQTLLSNQASWLNFSHNSDLSLSDENIGTRVFIPLPLGLLELFVTRQVPEDQQVVDFIRAQCNIFLEHQARTNSGTSNCVSSDQNPHKNPLISLPHSHVSQVYPSYENMEFPHLCTSLNPLQNFSTTSEIGNANNCIFLEGTTYDQSNLLTTSQSNIMSNLSSGSRWMDPSRTIEDQMNDESYTCENKGSDESDPNEDENDAKYRRRNGKGPQSKNLVAERKRRKKLNDRLYSLRALVPNISKLDRASILGDAIDYVKELQKQVNDLQIELEEHSDGDEDGRKTGRDDVENRMSQSILNQNGSELTPKHERRKIPNGFHKGSSGNISEQNHELDNANDEVQQMEPQVEVFQLEGNEFLVKVFCEHKCGGFVRLMEALNSLGLEVTDLTATRHTCLVSSIFKVERKNQEIVHADHVRESLLELTRNPSRVLWPMNVAEESDIINRNNVESDRDDYHVIHHNNGEHSLFLSHQMNSHHHH